MAVHFVGFRDGDSYWRACQVFGKPDFIHRNWDVRTVYGGEYDPENDFFVFAKGDENSPVAKFPFNDSECF